MKAPKFWQEPPGLAAAALAPAAAAVSAAGRLRHALARPSEVPVPVLCVGNLVAGGAGKTPTVLALAARLTAMGLQPHVLSRGYGGRVQGPYRVDPTRDDAAAVGDEPRLMARRFPVWVGADRAASAEAAVGNGAEALILDDGFQNPGLVKDFSVVVIDAGMGHGNGRVMPAGPLREPLSTGFARADAAIVIGTPTADRPIWIPPDLPTLAARLTPRRTDPPLTGRPVVAFAGIGRPQKFFETVQETGAELVDAIPFGDHEPYSAKILARLAADADRAHALLVTTEKDAERLPESFRRRCVALGVDLGFREPAALDRLLQRALFSPA